LHEIPHEVGDFGVLISAGWSKRNTILANLFSALSTVVASVVTYLFADQVTPSLGILLGISAGVFLYLGASDFLPDLASSRGKSRTSKWVFMLLGILMIFAVTYLAPEH
jgi:zinc and cadmium transporter